jgi:hypothetical protein
MENWGREWDIDFTCFPQVENKEDMTANGKPEVIALHYCALAKLAHELDSIGL